MPDDSTDNLAASLITVAGELLDGVKEANFPTPDNQVLPTLTFFIIRHVSTNFNSVADPAKERMRGWLNVPPQPDSYIQVANLVAANEDKLRTVDIIYSSDLDRAVIVGKAVSSIFDTEYVPTKSLRPWHVGVLEGQLVSEALPNLIDFARNKPDQPVPGGESFNDFKTRIFTGLAKIIARSENRKFAIVTHNRVERLLTAWLAQGCPSDFSYDFCVFARKGLETGAMEPITLLPSRLYSPAVTQGSGG